MLQNVAADGHGVAFDRVLVHVVEGEHFVQLKVAVHQIFVVADFVVRALDLLVLVPDLADDLLEQILHRHNAQRAAVFVGDDRHVHLGALEVAEDFAELLGFKDKIRRLQQALQVGHVAVGKRFKIVARVQDADNIVGRVFKDRNARVTVFENAFLDFFGAVLDIDKHHIHARREDLLGSRFVKVQRRAHHLALALFQNALFLNALHNIFQLVFGHARRVVLTAGDFERERLELDEDKHQRREDDHQHFQKACRAERKVVAVLLGKAFGDHLAEGQHQKRGGAGGDSRADIAEQVQAQHGGDG